jgi:uncharacterized membrane protein YesL
MTRGKKGPGKIIRSFFPLSRICSKRGGRKMKLNGNVYKYCDWIMKFGYLNLLWMLFTLTGLIIFGFIPATISLFTITRAWIRGNTDIPIWSTFLKVYKSEFVKSNKVGLVYLLGGYVLFIDERFLVQSSGSLNIVLVILLLIVAVLFLISFMYFFPTYVHFKLNPLAYIRYSIMMGLSQFPYTIIMVAGVWFTYILLRYLPGVFLFFGSSILSYIVMWSANKAFEKVRVKAMNLQKLNTL